MLYGLLHSWLASLRVKAAARHWFGAAANRWFRLFFNMVAGLTLLPVLVLPVVLEDQELYRIPAPWSWLTWITQGIALVLLVVGVMQTGVMSFLGIRQLLTGTDERASRLVVDGLYRYVRHPLYTAGLVIIWLLPVMSCNLLALNIGLTLYIMIGALFEERKMMQDFGEVYAAYRRRTPMLIPGLRFKK